jgi:protein-disulfide isomerase
MTARSKLTNFITLTMLPNRPADRPPVPKPRPLTNRLSSSLLVVALILTLPQLASAQQSNRQQNEMKREIEALKQGQATIQNELQEVKKLMLLLAGGKPSPEPARPETINIANSPSVGEPGARLVVVEFSDYQCPYCSRFFRDTMPLIEQEFINTGKVRYVFRNLPLESIHPFAVKAAEAADCAGEQGRFWQMHRRLFSNQEALGPADLQLHAQSIGLDLTRFNQCLSGGSHAPAIRKGAEEAFSAGIQGTPAFVIGIRNEKDPSDPNIKVVSIISGAQPYSVFKSAINNMLGAQNE